MNVSHPYFVRQNTERAAKVHFSCIYYHLLPKIFRHFAILRRNV